MVVAGLAGGPTQKLPNSVTMEESTEMEQVRGNRLHRRAPCFKLRCQHYSTPALQDPQREWAPHQ